MAAVLRWVLKVEDELASCGYVDLETQWVVWMRTDQYNSVTECIYVQYILLFKLRLTCEAHFGRVIFKV